MVLSLVPAWASHGFGKENDFDILNVCYPRCVRTLGHIPFRSRLTFAEEAVGLPALTCPVRNLGSAHPSCVVTFGHCACQASPVAP